MKTLNTLVLALVLASLTLTGSAFAESTNPGQSSTDVLKVVGVFGMPAYLVEGRINAINVDQPSALDEETLNKSMKEKGLDYLIVVNTMESTEQRNDNAHTAKKAGLFALSIIMSAISHNSVNLNRDQSSRGITVRVVTTQIDLYGQNGKLIRTKTVVKKVDYSETLSTTEVAAGALKELFPQS